MSKLLLTKETEFLVSDKKWLLILLAAIFFGIFLIGFITTYQKGLKNMALLDYVNFIFLFLSLLLIIRIRAKHIYIRINKTGIFYKEVLLTDWKNFLKADVIRIVKPWRISWSDDLGLSVAYTKDVPGKGYRKKIPLPSTQDQSIEDIVAAIRFFWNDYCKSV